MGDLGERHTGASQLLRNRDLEVAELAKLVEVFVEEAVVAVVGGSALAAAQQQVFSKQGWVLGNGHGYSS